jgi:hypothetical protein
VREVEQQPVGLLLPNLLQQTSHVAGGLPRARVAIPVERREVERCELQGLALTLQRDEAELRGLLGEVDLVALDANREPLDLVRLSQHRELNAAALATPDQAHDVLQIHVHDVHGVVAILCDRDDLVAGLQIALAVGRAAGNDLFHDRVAIATRERGADALQREARADLKLFEHLRRQVARVRIEGGRETVEQ